MNINKVLEPSEKVGSGNIVVESCSSQLAEHDGASLNLQRSDEPDEQQQVPISILKPQKDNKNSDLQHANRKGTMENQRTHSQHE